MDEIDRLGLRLEEPSITIIIAVAILLTLLLEAGEIADEPRAPRRPLMFVRDSTD